MELASKNNSKTSLSGKWRLSLFILSILYLFIEAVFNSQLVEIVGAGRVTPDELEQLELFGRAASGIGVTLFIIDLIPDKFFLDSRTKAIKLIMISAICWPLTFFGQKWLVDTYIIDASTAESRKHAVFSMVFRDALATEAIVIQDLTLDEKQTLPAERKTLLAIFGSLIYSDNSLFSRMESESKQVISNYIDISFDNDSERYYQQYQELSEEVREIYIKYARANNRYSQAIVDIPKTTNDVQKQIDDKIKGGWETLSNAREQYFKQAKQYAKKYQPKLVQYFEHIEKCGEKYSGDSNRLRRCTEPANKRYKQVFNNSGLSYIEPSYWLIKEEVSFGENLAALLPMVIASGGGALVTEALSGMFGKEQIWQDYRYIYSKELTHYEKRFASLPQLQQKFEAKTRYSLTVRSFSEYEKHPQTIKAIKEYLRAAGINIPDNKGVFDRKALESAVASHVRREAQTKWEEATFTMGINIPRNLTWENFQKHPDIQDVIKSKAASYYIDNVKLGQSASYFQTKVLSRIKAKEKDRYFQLMNAAPSEFGPQGPHDALGKSALRAIVIPPIAMGLSLLLICLTLLRLPVRLLSVIRSLKGQPDLKLTFKAGTLVITFITLLWVPIQLIKSDFTKNDNSPTNYLLSKAEQRRTPALSYGLRWTLHVQPILLPFGNSVENITGIYGRGTQLLQDIKSSIVIEDESESTFARLTVKTIPKNARVRIMNIKPKYYDGIELMPGRYDIEVDADGHETFRRWYTLGSGSITLEVELNKQ